LDPRRLSLAFEATPGYVPRVVVIGRPTPAAFLLLTPQMQFVVDVPRNVHIDVEQLFVPFRRTPFMVVKVHKDSIEGLILHAEKSLRSLEVILTWAELEVDYTQLAGTRLLAYGKKGL
jgi:hypothetical protein